jgi:hypothetical protein
VHFPKVPPDAVLEFTAAYSLHVATSIAIVATKRRRTATIN